MEKGTNKDWMDAVRERCLSDEAAPVSGGWEAMGTRMRRAAARRRAALAAAVAVPAAALLLWAPWRQPANTAGAVPPLADSSVGVPDYSPPAQTPAPSTNTAQIVDGTPILPAPSTNTAQNEDEIPDRPSTGSRNVRDEEREPGPMLAELEQNVPKPRNRARIASVSLRAGSGTVGKNAPVPMASTPYLAALNFLNTTDLSLMPQFKSNASNTREISATANAFFPESSAGQYSHALPLSLGIALRVDLTPKIGLETGLEYAYLHSVEEFAGSRLNQRLHFVGIPVRLDASLWTKGAFGMYAGVGAKMEKCVSASLGRVACEEPRLQWSAEAFVGVQYQLSSRIHLYFQPALSYYFTKTDLPTYRTEHPLGVTLHAGLRFDFQSTY